MQRKASALDSVEACETGAPPTPAELHYLGAPDLALARPIHSLRQPIPDQKCWKARGCAAKLYEYAAGTVSDSCFVSTSSGVFVDGGVC